MKHHARLAVALSALVAGGAAAALPALSPASTKPNHPAATGKTRVVGVYTNYYDPPKLTVHVGDRIKWVWHATGLGLHDVYVDSGPEEFNSPTQAGGTFTHRFKKAGTFKLYCTEHPEMDMAVTVKKVRK
jgi:plastocyanin